MEAVYSALKSILCAKGRSFLTMLGIIIGVGAVMAIVGLGDAVEVYVKQSFAQLGTNQITVSLLDGARVPGVDDALFYAVLDEQPGVFSALSPVVEADLKVNVGRSVLQQAQVSGVSEQYLQIDDLALDEGRFLSYIDVKENLNTCVISDDIAQRYYPFGALGDSIKIGGVAFEIVGVFKSDNDRYEPLQHVFIPYTTALPMAGLLHANAYIFLSVREDDSESCVALLKGVLGEYYDDEEAYSVTSMHELLDTMSSMINMVVLVLSSIAALSLFVGGVGIMNIMLISVGERTKEIGVRKALGAKDRDILIQFVTEAAMLGALGGAGGIVLGYVLCFAASEAIGVLMHTALDVRPTFVSMVISVGISVSVGMLFGFLPARKAAKLDPVQALRSE